MATLIVAGVSSQIVLAGIGLAQIIREFHKDFENEMEALISSQDYVQRMVQSKDTAEVNDAVRKWLQDADELIKEKTRLEMEVQTKKRFFQRLYYSVRKLISRLKMISKLKALNTKVKSMPLFIPIRPIQVMKSFPVGNFEYFQSTTEAKDKLMEALRDDTCHIIGLYGLRGSGKTALVKAVFGEEANYSEMFDLIVFATVSKNPNIGRIQAEVADCLGLKLKENSDVGRSRRILSRFCSHKRVLVIFDDVRAKLDLGDIGIPYKGDHKELKVLFTTPDQQVCTSMDCDKEVALHPLSEVDSWKLLKKHAGMDEENNESSSSLLNVAREVAIECKGLPGKIKDVGSSLKGKPIEEWEASLDTLRHSTASHQYT
ncbi:hypothetical protein RJT34_10928 [Clitoria ternatea]|uniref:NB-ARC domain-containing protein n=1 Tax=Clitoria ternatea TaxID=43366 RepID=A0AAN9PHZ3_CLITE